MWILSLLPIRTRRRDYDFSVCCKMSEVDVARHVAYCRRCLNLLPGAFTSNDLNRLSLGFFLLNALDILDHLSCITPEEREEWINWIYSCQIPHPARSSSAARSMFQPRRRRDASRRRARSLSPPQMPWSMWRSRA